MYNKKKFLSGLIAFSLAVASAAPVSAAEKEEVIYVIAKADGSIESVYAVNSFDGGEITDYGDYSAVKLMNVDGEITQNGDEIAFKSPENQKVYYQGTLSDAQIPWDISIRYFLDGTEYSAEEIAGKSGALEIKISITENENRKSDFYDNYALQCSFTLDTAICKNISAEGATLANVGSKKQITYTALAGSGLDRVITADVTDFEMASASINGIRMNLGLEIDGDIDLDGEITDLIDGANQLDDGAKELYDGAVELNGGVNELNQGIKELSDGIGMAQEGLTELSGKASELTGGSDQIKNGLLTLQSALCDADGDASAIGGLIEASGQIKAGINSLCDGISQLKGKLSFSSYKSTMKANGLDLDQLKAGNELAVQQLSAQITELEATLAQIGNVPGYEEQAAQLSAQIEQLEGIVQLLTGSCAMIDGTGVYFGGLYQAASQLQTGADSLSTSYKEFDSAVNVLADSLTQTAARISALSDGINTLVTEYEKLDSGIKEYTHGVQTLCEGMEKIGEGADELVEGGKTLADGTAELADGIKELADGTGELQDKTSSIDSDKTQELTDMLETLTEEHQVTSFVSDKNTDVASVQFVISTKAIEIPQEEAEPEEAEAELNFWQKLLRLFGIN